MRILLVGAFACLFLSCNIKRHFDILKYKVDNKGHKLILKIPKGYVFTHVGWESLYDGYEYKDSSVLYITDRYNAGINRNNIKEAGLEAALFKAKMENDTVTFGGIDQNGLYWKYSALGVYGIGYKNVKQERKEEFDKIITDAHIK